MFVTSMVLIDRREGPGYGTLDFVKFLESEKYMRWNIFFKFNIEKLDEFLIYGGS